jgi:myo-inositol-1(or 4)-monophosphatase
MDSEDLRKRMALAKTLAEQAGHLLLKRFGALTRVDYKGSVDLVTDADEAAEALIRVGVTEAFPEDRILAEEGGEQGSADGAWCWVIDPLDGTTNFVHGVNRFAVSVGITHLDAPVGGVIYDPSHDALYHAMSGAGAWRGAERLNVSTRQALGESLLVTGFPYNRSECAAELTAVVARAMEQARGVRRFGAASLDFVDVAKGVLDGYWEPRLAPWDMAAGVVLVCEAGGVVSRYEGRDFTLQSPDIIASNGAIHSALIAMVRGEGEGV